VVDACLANKEKRRGRSLFSADGHFSPSLEFLFLIKFIEHRKTRSTTIIIIKNILVFT